MKEERNRVKFYSKTDGASWYELKKATKILNSLEENNAYTINDYIEFFEIKIYFDNDLFLPNWSVNEKENYISKSSTLFEKTKLFWVNNINNENIISLFEDVDYGYYNSFWVLTNKFSIYKNIEKNTFKEITKSNRFGIYPVLKQQNIINYFSRQIRSFLLNNSKSAEVLLSYFEEEERRKKSTLYFPNCLNSEDKENMILNYINYENANINYIRLIENSKTIKLSDKTKLLAKKKSKQLNDEIFERSEIASRGISVIISKEQQEPVKTSFDEINRRLEYIYSEPYLDATKSFFGIYKNFKDLFGFINYQGCIDLVHKESEVDVLERVSMKSKNEYFISFNFHRNSLTSQLQLFSYSKYLKTHNLSIENSLNYVVNEYINEVFNINGLRIRFPSEEASFEEKIRILAPELEFLIKQYQSYVDNQEIDFELLEFSTNTLHFSKIKSAIKNKYVYGVGNDFLRYKNDFFSDQSSLFYTNKFKSKYKNLYQLLTNEDVLFSDFKSYQTSEIEYLISKDILTIDDKNYVKIRNTKFVYVLKVLHYQGVLNYFYYKEEIRKEILSMKSLNLIEYDNSFFTIEERRYLNYYLNKKEFTNSLDLRNKYLHGTNSKNEAEHERDYHILLKLLILVIHKINEDLKLENTVAQINL